MGRYFAMGKAICWDDKRCEREDERRVEKPIGLMLSWECERL